MLWELRYSRDSFSVEAAVEKGRPLPDWYLQEPVLQGADGFYLRAFWDLSSCRPSSFSVGPIPWNLIVQYAERYGLDEDIVESFIYIMRAMDKVYLDWVDKELENKTK